MITCRSLREWWIASEFMPSVAGEIVCNVEIDRHEDLERHALMVRRADDERRGRVERDRRSTRG